MAPDKAELRRRILARRAARSDADLAAARRAIRGHLLRRAGTEQWRTVAAYVPLRTEPGSVELLDGLRTAGADVLVPLRLPDNDLDWTAWPAGAPLGIGAVARCDVLLVPALAVARSGVRLGRGGGSYDRALTRRSPACVAIALVFDDELLDDVPADPWDVPVDEAACPAGLVALQRS